MSVEIRAKKKVNYSNRLLLIKQSMSLSVSCDSTEVCCLSRGIVYATISINIIKNKKEFMTNASFLYHTKISQSG